MLQLWLQKNQNSCFFQTCEVWCASKPHSAATRRWGDEQLLGPHRWFGRCQWHSTWLDRQVLQPIFLACSWLQNTAINLPDLVHWRQWMGHVWNASESNSVQHACGHRSGIELCELRLAAQFLRYDALLVGSRSHFFEALWNFDCDLIMIWQSDVTDSIWMHFVVLCSSM